MAQSSPNQSMKEGSLFCFAVMRSAELGCFRSCSWCLWKALDKEGCMGLILWCLDLWCKSSWILNDFFTSWKFWRNWNLPLVFLERSWWAGFNGIYLVRFGFRMWEILIFLVISAAKNSNKFQKNQVLEGKITWGCGNTLGPMARATLVYS